MVNKKANLYILCKRLVLGIGTGVLGSVLLILLLLIIKCMPHTKTNFKSYEAFREKTHDYYPNEQPASASKIKYYYCTRDFDEFSAVAFTVNKQDFIELSEYYRMYFEKSILQVTSNATRYQNQAIPENFIRDENIEFLNEMIDERLENYTIVEYYGSSKSSERRTVEGVIGNESTGEIIILFGYDCFPEDTK